MDVLRTGVSVLGCVRPEAEDHNEAGARDIADALLASLPSMLLYWHHYARNGKRIAVDADSEPLAAHFLHLLHGSPPSAEWTHAMQVSLILYAEHEFNASTFTARVIAGTGSDIYSCIAGAIGALKGPKHGGANEVALEIQQRYATADEAEADIRRRVDQREVIIGFGHPVYTISDPRSDIHQGAGARVWPWTPAASASSPSPSALRTPCTTPSACFPISIGTRAVAYHLMGIPVDCSRHVRDGANRRLVRARDRAAPGRQDHPPSAIYTGPGESEVCADCSGTRIRRRSPRVVLAHQQ
jgi:2-methylcitrate synthase